jgi:thiosulfate reductase cytochrome b subunit
VSAVSDSEPVIAKTEGSPSKGPLIYRQALITRITHWIWAVCLFFLLLSGLQIFNSHPHLQIGQESGFEYDNSILSIYSTNQSGEWRGYTRLFGRDFDTTGVLGLSEENGALTRRAFPAALTIPSYHDLATGRVVHFFFAWLFVATLFVWFLTSLVSGHLLRDVVPKGRDLRALPGDIADHARFRFKHGRTYNALQKIAYTIVFFILFPLIILTGLTMSPGMDTAWPWLLDLFGGRQTARTIHFATMLLLVLFFIIHLVMVVLAGPFNELRSMITGWYRASPGTAREARDR